MEKLYLKIVNNKFTAIVIPVCLSLIALVPLFINSMNKENPWILTAWALLIIMNGYNLYSIGKVQSLKETNESLASLLRRYGYDKNLE